MQLVSIRPLRDRITLQQLLHEIRPDGVARYLTASDSVVLLALVARIVLLLGRLEVTLGDAASCPS